VFFPVLDVFSVNEGKDEGNSAVQVHHGLFIAVYCSPSFEREEESVGFFRISSKEWGWCSIQRSSFSLVHGLGSHCYDHGLVGCQLCIPLHPL
jgi:hypothetical protein